MTVRQILSNVGPEWDLSDPGGQGFARRRFLQDLDHVVGLPVNNRVTANTNATAVVLNGAPQSTGIGTGPITPARYGEHQIQARVTLNASAAGNHYVYVYRTTGNIPANGAAPNAGDVVVGTDAFGGGALPAAINTPATLSVIDDGLNPQQSYKYYFAVMGPNGATLNLVNGSRLMASEF